MSFIKYFPCKGSFSLWLRKLLEKNLKIFSATFLLNWYIIVLLYLKSPLERVAIGHMVDDFERGGIQRLTVLPTVPSPVEPPSYTRWYIGRPLLQTSQFAWSLQPVAFVKYIYKFHIFTLAHAVVMGYNNNDCVSVTGCEIGTTSLQKPPYTYATLIWMALEKSPNQTLSLQEIYAFIHNNFQYYNNNHKVLLLLLHLLLLF